MVRKGMKNTSMEHLHNDTELAYALMKTLQEMQEAVQSAHSTREQTDESMGELQGCETGTRHCKLTCPSSGSSATSPQVCSTKHKKEVIHQQW